MPEAHMKKWTPKACDQGYLEALAKQANVHPLIAQLLIGRGVNTLEDVDSFLKPKLTNLRHPKELPGCQDVAEKLLVAIKADKKITVYGDYDVDGMTGTAILRQAIRLLGGRVNYYVPSRLTEGYGLNNEAIRTLAAEGTELIITNDCGINSLEEAETAKEAGVEMLITDHHTPGKQLPNVSAIAHPQIAHPQSGDTYPFPELSGAMVAFKVAWALCNLVESDKTERKKLSQPLRDFLIQAVDRKSTRLNSSH